MVRTSLDWILLNPSAAAIKPLQQDQAITLDAIMIPMAMDITNNATTNAEANAKTDAIKSTLPLSPPFPLSLSMPLPLFHENTTSDTASLNHGSTRKTVFTHIVDAASATKHQLLALLSWIGDSIAALFCPRDGASNTTTTTTTPKTNTCVIQVHEDKCDYKCDYDFDCNGDCDCEQLMTTAATTHHIAIDIDIDTDSESESQPESESDSDEAPADEASNDQQTVCEDNDAAPPSTLESEAASSTHGVEPAHVAPVPAPTLTASSTTEEPKKMMMKTNTTVAPTATTTATTTITKTPVSATAIAAAFVAEAQTHTKTPIRLPVFKLDPHQHHTHAINARTRRVDLPSPAPDSLLAQYVCECGDCPFVSTITQHVALAYAHAQQQRDAVDINESTTSTDNETPHTLVESLMVWRILRALALYNETRAPRCADVALVMRMLRRCANSPERAFEQLVDSGCFDVDVDVDA